MGGKTRISRDWLALGLLTGAGASIVKSGANFAAHRWLRLPTISFGSGAACAVLGKRARLGGLVAAKPQTPGEWVVGYVADTAIGSLFGAGFSYLHTQSPPGREVLKGAAAGSAVWLLTSFAASHLGYSGYRKPQPLQTVTYLAANVLFGAVTGALIDRYASVPAVQQPQPASERSRASRDVSRVTLPFQLPPPGLGETLEEIHGSLTH